MEVRSEYRKALVWTQWKSDSRRGRGGKSNGGFVECMSQAAR